MQEPSLVRMVYLHHNIPIPSSARRRHNVLVKRKRNENNHCNQIHSSTHCAHALWQLRAVDLAQVAAPEAGLDEGRAEPPDHGVA